MKEEIQKYLEYKQESRNRELSEYLMCKEGLYDKSTKTPFEISNDEYDALYTILKEDIDTKNSEFQKRQLQSINDSLGQIDMNLSVIKGIMLFTLMASIFVGVVSACNVLS